MKTFKYVDWIVSLALILISVVVTMLESDALFYGYFLVGGWQIISMLVHEWSRWFTLKGSLRRNYHRVVFMLVAVAVIAFLFRIFFPVIIVLAYTMLVAAPFMAMLYTKMCYDEWKELCRRPISFLR